MSQSLLVWDGLCGDGRPRKPVLSEVEGSKPSEARQLFALSVTIAIRRPFWLS